MHLHVNIVIIFMEFTLINGFGVSWWTQLISSAAMSDSFSDWFIRTRCLGVGQNFTYFMYYSRLNVNEHRFLVSGNKELLHASGYDATRPTKIIIHGFLDCVYVTEWMQKMKSKLLRTGDFNVVIVDWSCGNGIPYAQTIINSKITAKETIKLFEFLIKEAGADATHFHLIGHSVGTMISALIGQGIPNLGRISALDPPGPRFYNLTVKERLDPSDANFVDVIHSDVGTHLLDGLGLQTRIGHLDFYPNGGRDQPGCRRSPFTLFPGIIRAFRHYFSCDHFLSIEYYIESIKSPELFSSSDCHFVSASCRKWENFERGECTDCTQDGNCAFMGYNSNLFWNFKVRNQDFYVKTSGEEPFCLFQYRIVVVTEDLCEVCTNTSSYQPFRFTPGVIRLEVRADKGRLARLDDKEEKKMIPGRQYAYLATSPHQIEAVRSAELWFGSEIELIRAVSLRMQPTDLKIKKIQIIPFQLPTKAKMYSAPKTTILCPSQKALGRNIILSLIVDDC